MANIILIRYAVRSLYRAPPQVSRESTGSLEAETLWRTALALRTEGNRPQGEKWRRRERGKAEMRRLARRRRQMTLEPEAQENPQNGHGEGGEEEKTECEERRMEGALEEEGEQEKQRGPSPLA